MKQRTVDGMKWSLTTMFVLLFSGLTMAQTGGFSVEVVAAPDSVCEGVSSQLSSMITGGVPPFTYVWTPAGSLDDPSIPDPVATPEVTTKYILKVTDAVMDSITDSVVVTVLTSPPSPGTISGPDIACRKANATYSVMPVPGSESYSWMVPEGATILSGQNSPVIELLWDTTGGTVSVIAGNACGNSTPSVKEVILTVLPDAPEMIFGNESGCKNSMVSFFTDSVPGAVSYFWTVPSDAMVVTGQGTTNVMINWGVLSGNVTVVAENVCGQSVPCIKSLVTDSTAGDAGMISGSDTVCLNQDEYLYSIGVIPNADTYFWMVPEGANIQSGQNTNSIVMEFGQSAVSGKLSVYAVNECGQGAASSLDITVVDCSAIPETPEGHRMTLFPNPVKDRLNIFFDGHATDMTLQIRNLTGELVRTGKIVRSGESSFQVDVTGLSDGIYFIRLIDHFTVISGKFVVRQ